MLERSSRLLAWLAGRPMWLRVVLVLLAGLPVLLPAWIIRRTGGSRGGKVGAAAVMVFSLLVYMLAPERPTPVATAAPALTQPQAQAPEPTPTAATEPQVSEDPTGMATETRTEPPSTAVASEPPARSASPRTDDAPVLTTGMVVDMVDGDTIDLADGTRIRLAIVNTPEVYGGVESCGREASAFTAAFVADQIVAIYRPDNAPKTDRNGRTVGEVVRVTDGASLNVALVEAGLGEIDRRFAHEDPDLTTRLEAALERADSPACAATAAPEPSSSPTPAPASPPPPAGDPSAFGGSSCHPAYDPCVPPPSEVGDLNCPDIRDRYPQGVRVEHAHGDPHGLDGDEDGHGCE